MAESSVTPTTPSPEALAVRDEFARKLGTIIREGLARGIPYSTMRDGRVVWVYADGSEREASDVR